MKKTGKALSLVLSLALVVSSLTATFASATAASDPVAQATVAVKYTVGGGSATAFTNDSIALYAGATNKDVSFAPTISYTASNGKVYTEASGNLPSVTYSTSDSSIVSVDSNGVLAAGKKAGTAAVTVSFSGAKLYYDGATNGTHPGDTVTVSGSKSITVQTVAATDLFIDDTAPGAGTIPAPTTELAVNDTPAYTLYQPAKADKSDLVTYASVADASYTKGSADGVKVSWNSANTAVSGAASDAKAGSSTTYTIAAQAPTAVHIAGTKLTATVRTQSQNSDTDDEKTAKYVSTSINIHTAQIYTVKDSTKITADSAYGSGKAMAGSYVVTNYGIKDSGTNSVEIDGGTVASVTSAGTSNNVTVAGGNVTGLVKSAKGVTVTAGTVGSIDATGDVSISSTSSTINVGDISSDGIVAVSGPKVKVGNIRSDDAAANTIASPAISVNNGATAGSVTGVAKPVTTAGAFGLNYPAVLIDSATVNGNVIGGNISIDGSMMDSTTNTVIPTVVKGNVLVNGSGYPDATSSSATATIGSGTPNEKVTVTGSVADQTGSSQINLYEAKNGVTTVGALIGNTPASKKTASTNLTLDGYTGTFSSLPNFDSLTVTDKSCVRVTSPLAVNSLNLGSDTDTSLTVPGATLSLASGTNATYALLGSGKLIIPAGTLVIKGVVSGAPVIAPSTNVAVGTLIFKGVANLANSVTVPGITLDQKDNGDNTYNYVAKTVTFGGIQLDQSAAKIAKGYTGTIKATTIPTGAALPTGDSIKWEVPDGSSVTVTPSADGMSAVVKATSWSDVDLGGANEVPVKAYVVNKDGNEVYDYAEQTCNVTVIEKPEVVPTAFTCDSFPTTMKAGQQYTVKITSNDGTAPKTTFADGWAVITKTTTSGNSTFVSFTAKTAGEHGVYVGGNRVAIIKVAGSICDTTTVSKKAGQPYTFKVTSLTKAAPTFVVAGIGSIKPSKVNGNAYYYTVKATANKGVHGVYVNGAAIALYTFA